MAHHVTVGTTPQRRKDGSVIKGRFLYFVKCQRTGCYHPEPVTSQVVARQLKMQHHSDVAVLHAAKHPNDKRSGHVKKTRRYVNTR